MSPEEVSTTQAPRYGPSTIHAGLVLFAIVGALVVYKWETAVGILQNVSATGVMPTRADVIPLGRASDSLDR
ncbi:MAG: hypothetical protein HY644_07885 [Acidobacteria bacterium]|nr:hypothetical protein [Acidobacteriota bacterium]